MEKQPRNSGRRHEVLALLADEHSIPEKVPAFWTSAAVAEICGIGWSSAHHLLTRLKKYDLVEDVAVGETHEFRRVLKGDRTLVGQMPGRTLSWSLTDKGKGRLKYFGGHDKWCPICREV